MAMTSNAQPSATPTATIGLSRPLESLEHPNDYWAAFSAVHEWENLGKNLDMHKIGTLLRGAGVGQQSIRTAA